MDTWSLGQWEAYRNSNRLAPVRRQDAEVKNLGSVFERNVENKANSVS
jgi:hypothetical protein